MLLLYRHTRNNLLTLVKFYLEPKSMHDVLATCITVIAQTRGKDVFCLKTQSSACLCLLSTGTKGECHHAWLILDFLLTTQPDI